MKKIVLTVVAMMTLTMGYAKTDVRRPTRNVENYDMSFDVRRLAVKLDMTVYQMEAVEVIQNCFNNEMLEAATARGPHRRELVHQAVKKDVEQMQRVLNDKQFNTYMTLLRTTLHNHGF